MLGRPSQVVGQLGQWLVGSCPALCDQRAFVSYLERCAREVVPVPGNFSSVLVKKEGRAFFTGNLEGLT